MRLFIPELGTKLKLTSDWTFRLFVLEGRNQELGELFLAKRMKAARTDLLREFIKADKNPQEPVWKWIDTVSYDVTLPAGTVVTVDRIYIRRGQNDFDSITFRVTEHEIPWMAKKRSGLQDLKPVKPRFWVKLVDANNIECEVAT